MLHRVSFLMLKESSAYVIGDIDFEVYSIYTLGEVGTFRETVLVLNFEELCCIFVRWL